MESQENNLRVYLEKFTNFYKFLKDHEHFEVELFGNAILPKNISVTIAATYFILHIRQLRTLHPGVVKNIRDWTVEYYRVKEAKERPLEELSELPLFLEILTELVKIYKSTITQEKLQKLLQENREDAVIVIRYLDLFLDETMIPTPPQNPPTPQ